MMEERIINGKRCRYHGGLWFADTGDYVAHYNKDSGCYESCTIYLTINHGASVEELFYEEHLDDVIAELFGPPYPHDGKTYDLIHKDGNEMNCDYRNLEWREGGHLLRFPFHSNKTTASKVFLRYYHWIFEVYSTGIIKHGDEVLQQYDFDSYLFEEKNEPLLEICFDAGYYIVPVDEFMSRAGYVQGDINSFDSPVILHRDGDYKNFNSENLEWVEETDPRFISYMEKKEQAQQERIKELIEQGLLPPDWNNTKPPVSPHKPIQLPPALYTPSDPSNYGEALGPIDWAKIDPITGTPIVPQVPPSPEDHPAPFTPPNFNGFGETTDINDNPFKSI